MKYAVTVLSLFVNIYLSLLGAEPVTVLVQDLSGTVYIESLDGRHNYRAFRGSEVREQFWIKTDAASSVVIVVSSGGVKTSDVSLKPETVVLVNSVLFAKDKSKTSLSLISGHITVRVYQNKNNDTEIHTANTTTIAIGTDFEVAFADDGSTVVLLSKGSVAVQTDDNTTTLSPRDVHVTKIGESPTVRLQSGTNNPTAILNVANNTTMSSPETSVETLISAMRGISKGQDTISSRQAQAEREGDATKLSEVERLQHRRTAANLAYYNNILKIASIDQSKSRKMMEHLKTSSSLYSANKRSIDRMDAAMLRSQTRFEKARSSFESKNPPIKN